MTKVVTVNDHVTMEKMENGTIRVIPEFTVAISQK